MGQTDGKENVMSRSHSSGFPSDPHTITSPAPAAIIIQLTRVCFEGSVY